MPLKRLTTFQNEGVVTEDILIETLEDLKLLLSQKKSFFVLGKGSNTVINPRHKKGACVRLSADLIDTKVVESRLTVSAGMTVNNLVKTCISYGLSGLEFCAGVPATVGGMVTMNFGCWGKSMADCVEAVYILDENGNDYWISSSKLGFSYRYSCIQSEKWIVLGVTLLLSYADPVDIKSTTQSMIQSRLDKQPLKEKTFGSVFKNPSPLFAAELIEKAGLKGYAYGDVSVSTQHANFIVNKGQGTYDDLLHVVSHIQHFVQKNTGILLELEVKLIS